MHLSPILQHVQSILVELLESLLLKFHKFQHSSWCLQVHLNLKPVQDLFAIDNEGRINEPSTVGKNWKWRFNSTLLTDEKALELKSICDLYARNIGNKNEKD